MPYTLLTTWEFSFHFKRKKTLSTIFIRHMKKISETKSKLILYLLQIIFSNLGTIEQSYFILFLYVASITSIILWCIYENSMSIISLGTNNTCHCLLFSFIFFYISLLPTWHINDWISYKSEKFPDRCNATEKVVTCFSQAYVLQWVHVVILAHGETTEPWAANVTHEEDV